MEAGSVISILDNALSPLLFKIVLLISTVGQLFCAIACLTSCSRMMFAFSRDGAVPGHKHWAKVNKQSCARKCSIGICSHWHTHYIARTMEKPERNSYGILCNCFYWCYWPLPGIFYSHLVAMAEGNNFSRENGTLASIING